MKKRKLDIDISGIHAAKFYFFDIGLVRALKSFPLIQPKTHEFGIAFEHFILQEIRAYLGYNGVYKKLSFWRTQTGDEVDIIIADMEYAIEVKAKENVGLQDLKGLIMLKAQLEPLISYVVSLDSTQRQLANGIVVFPWQVFLQQLWQHKFIHDS